MVGTVSGDYIIVRSAPYYYMVQVFSISAANSDRILAQTTLNIAHPAFRIQRIITGFAINDITGLCRNRIIAVTGIIEPRIFFILFYQFAQINLIRTRSTCIQMQPTVIPFINRILACNLGPYPAVKRFGRLCPRIKLPSYTDHRITVFRIYGTVRVKEILQPYRTQRFGFLRSLRIIFRIFVGQYHVLSVHGTRQSVVPAVTRQEPQVQTVPA